MASLKDLDLAKNETEASSWMTVYYWEGTSRAGQPIDGGDGKPWRILVRNAHCHAFQKAMNDFDWKRELLLKLGLVGADDEPTSLQERARDAAVGATEEYQRHEAEKFREHLILDWENLNDEGVVIAATPVNVKRFIFDDYPQVFEQVRRFAFKGAGLIQTPADFVAEIEKKAMNGSDGEADSNSQSETEMDSRMDMPASSDLSAEASLPALA